MEGSAAPTWAVECIDRLSASGHATLAAVLDVSPSAGARRRLRGPLLPRAYRDFWLERRSLALRRADISDRVSGVPVIELSPPFPARLADSARDRLVELDLDFVLSFSAVALPEPLLALIRLGAWSLSQTRRAAPCLREVLEGRATTRVALEKHTPEGAAILHEGYFATCRASWLNNIDRALLGATDFCARACSEIVHGGYDRIDALPSGPPEEDRAPTNRDIAYLFSTSTARAIEKLWELLFHVEIWNVGFSGNSVQEILRDARVDARGVTWCKPHKVGHFIADPFVYMDRGQARVLVEDYDQVKGRICSLDPSDAREALNMTVDFEFPYHLSYPCVFEEDGETYCVPEAYQSKRASLYRLTEQGWSLVRHLIEGLPIVDPTLFKHAGRYWLLFTLQNDGAWGNQKLYAYHAPALDAPWVPHVLNPIKCDIGATRPAGNVFGAEGRLFRPSQDCSSTYGAAIVINEVEELSPYSFRERAAARIKPIVGGPYPDGLHTLNAMGDRAVFDSKRFAFDWLAWRKNWGRLHEVLQ